MAFSTSICRCFTLLTLLAPSAFAKDKITPTQVTFKNGTLELGGLLYQPKGKGPFPGILYNHGSAAGSLNDQAAKHLGPLFAQRGWVFFMPYRRGQGLSEKAGPYIMSEIEAVEKNGGTKADATALMIKLLTTDHLSDQLAGLAWLKQQRFIHPAQVATIGNSFGGIQVVLGAEKASYCAGLEASGGAQSWAESEELQKVMKTAVRSSRAPIFFFQAENDYDVTPSKVLCDEMKKTARVCEVKIYPPFRKSEKDGHAFPYLGAHVWFRDGFKFLKKHCSI